MVKRQTAALDKVVTDARSLWSRSDNIDTDSQAMKTLIGKRLHEYQALKTSTDEFGAWTCDLRTQTATAQLLGSSSQALLRRTTMQIVDALLETKQGDAKAICAKLKKPGLRSEARGLLDNGLDVAVGSGPSSQVMPGAWPLGLTR